MKAADSRHRVRQTSTRMRLKSKVWKQTRYLYIPKCLKEQ